MHFDSFGDRLRYIVDIVGSVAAVSRKTSISASTIKGYIEETNDPTRKKLIALADVGNVSLEWLATGKGDMRPWEKTSSENSITNLEDPLIKDLKIFLRDMTSKNPGWRTWFEMELIDKIPKFNEWREKKGAADPDTNTATG